MELERASFASSPPVSVHVKISHKKAGSVCQLCHSHARILPVKVKKCLLWTFLMETPPASGSAGSDDPAKMIAELQKRNAEMEKRIAEQEKLLKEKEV